MASFRVRYSLFILVLLLGACSRQPSITGEWKLAELKLMDQMSRSAVTIRVSHPGTARKQLRSLFYERLPSGEKAGEIESEIDGMLEAAQKAGLRLSSNREFGMDSYGFIVPKEVPGWHFGDRLLGDWDLKKDTLLLSIGDEEIAYTFYFLILEKTAQTLKLRELHGSTGDPANAIAGNEMTFSRK